MNPSVKATQGEASMSGQLHDHNDKDDDDQDADNNTNYSTVHN